MLVIARWILSVSRTTSLVASRGSLVDRKGARRGLKGSRSYDHSLVRSFVCSRFAVAICNVQRRGSSSLFLLLSPSRKGKPLVTRTILICNPRRSNGDRTLRTPPHPTSPLPTILHHPLHSVLPLSFSHSLSLSLLSRSLLFATVAVPSR